MSIERLVRRFEATIPLKRQVAITYRPVLAHGEGTRLAIGIAHSISASRSVIFCHTPSELIHIPVGCIVTICSLEDHQKHHTQPKQPEDPANVVRDILTLVPAAPGDDPGGSAAGAASAGHPAQASAPPC